MQRLTKLWLIFGFSCGALSGHQACEISVNPQPYINMHFGGRLGNQMFQVAAALSLAKDNNAQAIFSDLIEREVEDVPLNHKIFFATLQAIKPPTAPNYTFYEHPHFHFVPISFHPNMEIYGYFQSEKYFKHNKELICNFFEVSEEIHNYLTEKYGDLLDHPQTVAIHMRAYKLEDPNIEKCFPFLPSSFFMKAADLFPEDALFVIFSDNPQWAKEEMKEFTRPHVFIEGEKHYHDIYLMSFCKHQILSTSSFSWWGAYLNKNPNKIVVAPDPWFVPTSGHDSTNVIAEGWYPLSWQE